MAFHPFEQIKGWFCAARYRRLLLLALDGELEADDRARLDAHLLDCARCRTQYDRQTFAARLISQYELPDQPPAGRPQWEAARVTNSPAFAGKLQTPGRRFTKPLIITSVAASLLVLFIAGVAWRYWRSPESSWEVVRLIGQPKIEAGTLTHSGKLAVGELLETDAESRAMIQVGIFGQVEVDPNSRVRLLSTDAADHRLSLERGRLHASIVAPPRLFSVETPSATAVDLGCAYILNVEENGESWLHVTSGWVALAIEGREALVPAGATCVTKPGVGPGVPFMEDASAALKDALDRLIFENGGGQDVALILKEARPKDALTLWHLLVRVKPQDREAVFDRLASFAPLPEGVTRERALSLNRQALDLWRESVEYVSVGVDPSKIPTASGSLMSVGAMIDARINHSATLLKDGRVLIAGGRERSGHILASAELFDPVTRQFTPAGSLQMKRVGHTATLLANGKVLLAGGSDGDFYTGALASAELFDPATNSFTPAGNLLQPRLAHAATLLADGKVLLTGGQGHERANHDSAELYDPATNAFTLAGKMTERRADHTATLLKDGRVLVAGGGRQAQTDVMATAEIYDPASQTFNAVGEMSLVRYKHSAVLLPDGKVLIIGGSNARMWRGRYVSAELFDPATGKFTTTGAMNTARYKIRDAIAPLRDGRVLVAGGGKRVEVYDPATGLFAAVKGGLATTKYYATATLLASGEVLIAGGYSFESSADMPADAGAWLYKPE